MDGLGRRMRGRVASDVGARRHARCGELLSIPRRRTRCLEGRRSGRHEPGQGTGHGRQQRPVTHAAVDVDVDLDVLDQGCLRRRLQLEPPHQQLRIPGVPHPESRASDARSGFQQHPGRTPKMDPLAIGSSVRLRSHLARPGDVGDGFPSQRRTRESALPHPMADRRILPDRADSDQVVVLPYAVPEGRPLDGDGVDATGRRRR